MRFIRGTLRRCRRAAAAGALHNRWLGGWRVFASLQQLAVRVRLRAARRLGAPQCARAHAAVARRRARDDNVGSQERAAICSMLVSPWAVCFLACSFMRSSALLHLMYDMLTPVSEHAALRTALVKGVEGPPLLCLWLPSCSTRCIASLSGCRHDGVLARWTQARFLLRDAIRACVMGFGVNGRQTTPLRREVDAAHCSHDDCARARCVGPGFARPRTDPP